MSAHPDKGLLDFFAHAIAIEREAVARYALLAAQMRAHHNPGVAEVFDRLAGMEQEHLRELENQAARWTLPALKPWEYRWLDPESPESAPLDAAHYLMTPHHALEIAVANEKRAYRFFHRIAGSASASDEVRQLAKQFADEEREHLDALAAALDKAERPDAGWREDLDPPFAVD